MTDRAQPVNAQAVGDPIAPASVVHRAPLRRRPNLANNIVAPMPNAYTKGSGVPPLLNAVEGYQTVPRWNNTVSEFLPSILSLLVTQFLTCQRFASHDRFLKEVQFWHPYMDEIYICFCFLYHCLRVRREIGQLLGYELNLLADLEQVYPPTMLHIPGNYVAFFQAVTLVESPYEWQTYIAPRLPNLAGTTGARGFMPTSADRFLTPCIPLMINQIHQFCTVGRTTAAVAAHTKMRSMFGANPVPNNSQVRWNYKTPHGRFVNPSSARADFQFYQAITLDPTAAGGSSLNYHILDLPVNDNQLVGNTQMNLAQYMGIIDSPDAPNRSDRYRNWPMQYAAIMAMQAKYQAGSRSLGDIATTGLGAHTIVTRYAGGTIPNAATDPGAHDSNARNNEYLANLVGQAESRDPTLEPIAVQYAAICQVNPSFPQHDELGIPAGSTRAGPFWDGPIAANGMAVDALQRSLTTVPALISSVAL